MVRLTVTQPWQPHTIPQLLGEVTLTPHSLRGRLGMPDVVLEEGGGDCRQAGHDFCCVEEFEVARDTESPTTKLLAEGLTHLAEAIRALEP